MSHLDPRPERSPDGPRLPGRSDRPAEEGIEQAVEPEPSIEAMPDPDETSDEPLADADPTVPLLPEER